MIIFNEKEYCERLLVEGLIQPYHKRFKDVFVLCKYFKYLGYKSTKTKKELIKYIEKYDENFDINMNNQDLIKIHKIVKSVYYKKYYFRDKVEVSITNGDIERIKSLNSKLERKVYYALLFLSKMYKRSFVKVDYIDIIRLIEINTYNTEYLYQQILLSLEDKELIDVYEDGSYLIRDQEDNSKTIMIVDKFDIRELFIRINKSGGNCCENCGIGIEKKSNRNKYCSECFKERRVIQNRKKALKYYHKVKNFTK